MITIYDRADMARVLTLDLDPDLHALLQERFASLVTPYGDLTDWTEWLIIERGDTEADIVREAGFSPLTNPIDGARFGSSAFQPFWDALIKRRDWYEFTVTFGSTFAFILLVQDADSTATELIRLCRECHTPRPFVAYP